MSQQNIRAAIQWNTFQVPHNTADGWPLSLPQVDWRDHDCVILIFQDFVTMRDGRCLELEQVERFYGVHADRVIVLHWPHALHRYYQGAVSLVEFNVHEYNIMNNLSQRQHEWRPAFASPRIGQWQCLNGRTCPHRLRVVQHLTSWTGGILSYGDVVPIDHWPYSTYRGTSNEDNFVRLKDIYAASRVNIVTETQYHQRPGIVTEKTFFSLLAAQIPLVIGYRGIVSDCEAMGIDMFADVLDLSYDDLPDEDRCIAALELNRDRILDLDIDVDLATRLQRQQDWVLHQWPQQALDQALSGIDAVVKAQGWI